MLSVVALLSVFLCSSLAQDADLQARFGNFTELNANPLYELYWDVNGNITSFAVRVQTTGWVGLGISPDGTMLDSDCIVALVDSNGVASLTDRRTDATSRVEPLIDDEQDVTLVNGTEDGGFTIVEFSRPIDTGDLTGDRSLEGSVNLIWSLNTVDDTSVQHTAQGAQLNVDLLAGTDAATLTPPPGTGGPGTGGPGTGGPGTGGPGTGGPGTGGPGTGGPGTGGSCPCDNEQECSDGYVFDTKSCECVCAARASEDVWYQRYEECSRSHHLKIYSIFSCGCECSKRLKCHGNKVIEPNDCRCVCPTTSCTSPKYLNHHSCECECPYRRCYGGQTVDRDTCECKCTRTCQDHEELVSDSCYCRRKRPLTLPPTKPLTPPPITLTPPPRGSGCVHQSYHSCDSLHHYHGGPCRWVSGKCQPLCCGRKEGVRFHHNYRGNSYQDCSSYYSSSDCNSQSSCSWLC